MHYDIAAVCAVITLLVAILGGLVKAVERLTRIEEQLRQLQGMRTEIDAQEIAIRTLQINQARTDQRLENLEGTRQNSRDLRLITERQPTP